MPQKSMSDNSVSTVVRRHNADLCERCEVSQIEISKKGHPYFYLNPNPKIN